MYINQSVGAGGINKKNEVFFIQELLTLLATENMQLDVLKADGICGANTKTAIEKFQRLVVKLKSPDKRIDPNGRSEKLLIAKVNEMDITVVASVAKKHGLKKAGAQQHSSGSKQLIYRSHARKVVSNYSENIIKLAMNYAGISRCDISSTLRTFDDQARIMYNNCSAYPNATSVATLRNARGWGYRAAGQAVEEVYFTKKENGKEQCLKAMKDKVESLYKEGKKVSLHCVSEADYKKKNVLDIPYSSVNATKRQQFETALMGISKEILNIRYKKPSQEDTHIEKLIIEDKCWHLEIPQLAKTMVNKQGDATRTKAGTSPSTANQMHSIEEAIRSLLGILDRYL
ncbi:hypothetical protein P886_3053 [Alteromonadaceae bacterium 2753L.S.0a.02]|nr:hypothetical protein P886_3053 [Alteromonadaceae bacterium 2753L.S.0a.02]